MRLKLLQISVVLFFATIGTALSQDEATNIWKDHLCTIVLTYDDSTDYRLDNVIPVFDSLDLKATFYIPGKARTIYDRLNEWRNAAAEGHELGNHTLFHPCNGKSKNRKWVSKEYDLDNYTVKRFTDEILVNNSLLRSFDGETERTFAYTCGDTIVEDSSIVDIVKKYFIGARGTQYGLNYIDKVNLYNIKIFSVHQHPVSKLIKMVEKAKDENAMLVFLFHGVGGGSPYSISTADHSRFVHYLKQNENEVWNRTMVDAVRYIKGYRKHLSSDQ